MSESVEEIRKQLYLIDNDVAAIRQEWNKSKEPWSYVDHLNELESKRKALELKINSLLTGNTPV